MGNIFRDGINIRLHQNNYLHLSPEQIEEVLKQVFIARGKDIVEAHRDSLEYNNYDTSNISDGQYYLIAKKLENILDDNSGDSEWQALTDVLPEQKAA